MKCIHKAKNRMAVIILLPLFTLLFLAGCSQRASDKTAGGETEAEEFVISRGTNISHWLSQSRARGKEREARFTREDAHYLAGLGFDHLRLPVDEGQLWDESGQKNDTAFALLHEAIGWCRDAGLRCIVDLHIIRSHHFNHETRPLWTEPEEQEKLARLWQELSSELRQYPLGLVAYEIMNEAVAPDHEMWNKLQARVIEAIRKEEPRRKILAGSNMWQSHHTFPYLKVPENDPNIILSFHFYQPFPLTHYRASWTKIGEYTGPVHYPGQVIEVKDIRGLPGELVREIGHHNGIFTADSLEKMILVPVKRSRELGLPLYCGEWGCLPTVDAADRLQWYTDVRYILEKHGIAWATWDFRGSFGLVDRSTGKPDQELIDILLPLDNGKLRPEDVKVLTSLLNP